MIILILFLFSDYTKSMRLIVSFLLVALPISLALSVPLQMKAKNDLVDEPESSYNQQLDCYDQPNCYGTRITIGSSPVPDLANAPYYFDNRIVSCMYNGIYNLYDGWYYNQDNLNVSDILHINCCNPI